MLLGKDTRCKLPLLWNSGGWQRGDHSCTFLAAVLMMDNSLFTVSSVLIKFIEPGFVSILISRSWMKITLYSSSYPIEVKCLNYYFCVLALVFSKQHCTFITVYDKLLLVLVMKKTDIFSTKWIT